MGRVSQSCPKMATVAIVLSVSLQVPTKQGPCLRHGSCDGQNPQNAPIGMDEVS